MGIGDRRRGIGELGRRGVLVERRHHDEELPIALQHAGAPGRHRPPVAHPVDAHLEGLVGRAALHEVRVERVRRLVGDGRARTEQGLGDHLAAEDAVEAAGLVDRAEAVVAERFELERAGSRPSSAARILPTSLASATASRAPWRRHGPGAYAPGRSARQGGTAVVRDEKILITGPAGRIAYGLARSLVADNDVWGIARFSDPASRDTVEALGVTTRTLDIADGDFGDLPTDFTYLLHLAADFSVDDYDRALRVNAEGTGFVLEHCRNAKAALVMSTVTVYKPHPDPWHAFREDDPLGDAMAPPSAPYSVSKIAEEGVARYCARSFDLPVTIARMGAAYSDQSGLPVWHLDAVAAGEPVRTRWDPMTYSPIHDDDICAQLEPLLGVASVPATIVNWAGDEPVSVQEYSAFFGELLGVDANIVVDEIPGASHGSVGDHTRRNAITGPCTVGWRDGFRRVAEHFYPDRVRSA